MVRKELTTNINPLESSIVDEDYPQDEIIHEKGIYAIPFHIIHVIHTCLPMY